MKLQRRQLLKSLALGSGVAAAGSLGFLRALRADPSSNDFTRKRFVFVMMPGAWDTLLSVDPRDPNQFTEANVSQTGIQLAHHLLDAQYTATPLKTVDGIDFGPAVPDNFAALASKMCIGRGLTMDTLSHDVGRVFWSTGRTPAGINPTAPSIASQIVDQIAECDPDNVGIIPNLSIGATVFSNATEPLLRPFQIRNANDMLLSLKRGSDFISEAVLNEIADELKAYRDSSTLCDPAKLDRAGKMTLVRHSQNEIEQIIASNLSAKFNLPAPDPNDPQMVALYTHFLYPLNDVDHPLSLAAVAAQALVLNMSRCVSLRLGDSLDDHDNSWAQDQPADQQAAFDAIAKLWTFLEQTPLPEDASRMMSEETVIVIGSDFSRTPILNTNEGRDHWPVNACVFMGSSMPQGRVIGASTLYGMESSAIDPETGDVVPAETTGALTMNPGHWMASLMDNEGLSLEHLREPPLPCLSTS